jgi:hypothetical protein
MSVAIETELALLIDVGSAWAKASVIGRVRGRWRLVTRVAQPTAWGAGELHRSLMERLQTAVDPRLMPRLDELLASANRIECHTARRPGRIVVAAVSRELSGGAARRAAEAAGWQVAEVVTLDDGRSLADRLATLQSVETDAWVIAGGFDGSRSPRAMEAAAMVASARRRGSGPVIWAGSTELAAEVAALFEPGGCAAVGNVRPDPRREVTAPLREHLQGLLRTVVAREDETHLAAIALPRAIGALAAASGLRILAVDIGARGAISALAEPDGTFDSRIHGGGGLAGLGGVAGSAARVSRLAGDAGDEAAVADLLQTLRSRPASLPETPEELSATHAAARVQAASLVEDADQAQLDLVIGCGSTIAGAPLPAQAARMLLDGVRPIGVTQLALDAASVLGPLGTLPDDEIREGIGLLAEDLLLPLGTAVVSRGGEPGRVAMRVTVHRPGWPDAAPIEVRSGQLQVVPLARGQEAELTIEPGDGVTFGAGRRSPRIQALATGGAVGLILDARGIPIVLPKRGDDRRAMVGSWRDALTREPAPGVERVA